MTEKRRRRWATALRWIHLLMAVPILGYVYSPFDQIPDYAPPTRFVFVPILVLTGLGMWAVHALKRRNSIPGS